MVLLRDVNTTCYTTVISCDEPYISIDENELQDYRGKRINDNVPVMRYALHVMRYD